MIRRIVPLLIALAVGGAPVALEACQVVCASAPAHSARTVAQDDALHHQTASHHPSCHEASGAPQQVSSPTRACDHEDQTTSPGIGAAHHSDRLMLLAMPARTTDAVMFGRPLRRAPAHRSASPGGIEIPLTTPLRI
jgi:orotidine-5'-phosphate decarboxylase